MHTMILNAISFVPHRNVLTHQQPVTSLSSRHNLHGTHTHTRARVKARYAIQPFACFLLFNFISFFCLFIASSYCFRFPLFYFSQLDLFEIKLVAMCVYAYEVCANKLASDVAENAMNHSNTYQQRQRQRQSCACGKFHLIFY